MFGAKLRQAKLALSVGLAASPAYKRELDKRLQAFDRAVWVRLLATPITFVSALAPTLRWQGVHNSGPMPGEDEDDLWVESTQDDAPPNVKCPLTGKGVLELEEPVRCVLCKPQRRRTCSCPRVFPPCTAQGSEGLRVREEGCNALLGSVSWFTSEEPERWCVCSCQAQRGDAHASARRRQRPAHRGGAAACSKRDAPGTAQAARIATGMLPRTRATAAANQCIAGSCKRRPRRRGRHRIACKCCKSAHAWRSAP